MSSDYSIKKTISFIKTELKNHYPDNEITSFTFLILEYLLNYSKTQIQISQDNEISETDFFKINEIVNELKKYKPIQYIFGITEFYDLNFTLSPDVLIPRPETEELVDWIISENKNGNQRIIDIGTGSGCIAIALAKNIRGSEVVASDISENALSITNQNSKINNVTIKTLLIDILNPVSGSHKKFDIIVSNPPYITEKEKKLMHQNVLSYEPHIALFVPDEKPLLFYKAICKFATSNLNSGGKLYFEINEAYGFETSQLLKEYNFKNISIRKDI
ncbi:MAG: peptide chain release factor N(5)-glutamine methyltransferase, partial [Bacteroidales bacterium]|nr:peptide chain release factor N(5)-glutamine methyltransferase [Bacteroidales bacterium]